MKKFILISIFIYLEVFQINAQMTPLSNDTSLQALKNNFEKNMSVYNEELTLHLNKEVFLSNEIIYFQAFLTNIDKEQKAESNIIYVELINSKGKIICHKSFFVRNGTAEGQLELNDSLISGQYLVRSYTNWMRNFNPSSFYYQWIEIIGSKKDLAEVYNYNQALNSRKKAYLSISKEVSSSEKVKLKIASLTPNDSVFYAILHANREALSVYKLALGKKENHVCKIDLPKQLVEQGITSLTFFNQYQKPLFEKVFYKEPKTKQANPSFSIQNIKDTFFLTLNTFFTFKGNVSLLPSNSIAISKTIASDICNKLPSYIRQQLSDKDQIAINNTTINDILWRYEFEVPYWNSIQQDTPTYRVEKGRTIEGKTTYRFSDKPQPNCKITLISPDNRLFLNTISDEQGKFSFENLCLFDKSDVLLTATDQDGKTFNRHINASIKQPFQVDSIDIKKYYPLAPPKDSVAKAKRNGMKFIKNVEIEEVEVKAKKVPNVFKGDPYASVFDKIFIVDKEVLKTNRTMADLLETAGANKLLRYGTPTLFINGSERRAAFQLKEENSQRSHYEIKPFEGLDFYSVSQIVAIAIDESYSACCIPVSNSSISIRGAVKVITRNIGLSTDESKEKNPIRMKIKNGVHSPQPFINMTKSSPIATNSELFQPINWYSLESDSVGRINKFHFISDLKSDSILVVFKGIEIESQMEFQYKISIPTNIKN